MMPIIFSQVSDRVDISNMEDGVGVFAIEAMYSNETNRIGLPKIYQQGTGNPSENLGYRVTIQLTWNVVNCNLKVNGMYKRISIMKTIVSSLNSSHPCSS
jgi:hypothetical protein